MESVELKHKSDLENLQNMFTEVQENIKNKHNDEIQQFVSDSR